MTVSFILRLIPTSGDDLVGEIEAVDTGARTVIRSADELVAYLRHALRGEEPDVIVPV